MKKVFFGNSGAEANEGVIKAARKYSFLKYGASRNKIIALQNSFHGRTMAALSATGQDAYHNFFFPFVDGFVFAKANDFADILSKMTDDVCAVMLETVQGEGGVVPLDKEYVQAVAKACKEKTSCSLWTKYRQAWAEQAPCSAISSLASSLTWYPVQRVWAAAFPSARCCSAKKQKPYSFPATTALPSAATLLYVPVRYIS